MWLGQRRLQLLRKHAVLCFPLNLVIIFWIIFDLSDVSANPIILWPSQCASSTDSFIDWISDNPTQSLQCLVNKNNVGEFHCGLISIFLSFGCSIDFLWLIYRCWPFEHRMFLSPTHPVKRFCFALFYHWSAAVSVVWRIKKRYAAQLPF